MDVNTVGEVFKAIDANSKDFWKYLHEKDQEGVKYIALADKKPIRMSMELELCLKSKSGIDIVPVVKGAGFWDLDSGEDMAIAGAVLGGLGLGLGYLAENFMPEGFWQDLTMAIGDIAFDVGVAMVTSGLMSMLMEAPSVSSDDIDVTMPDEKKGPEAKNTTSFVFSRPLNNTTQGVPVPVGYGRLRVGSNVVSSSLMNCRITPFPAMTEDLSDEEGNLEGAISVDQFSSTTAVGALAPLTNLEIANVINSETVQNTEAIVKVKDGDGNTKSSTLVAFNAALNDLGAEFDAIGGVFSYGALGIRGINELWNQQAVQEAVEAQNNG